jgi:hypothetical protein
VWYNWPAARSRKTKPLQFVRGNLHPACVSLANLRRCAPRHDKRCPLGFYLNHALADASSGRERNGGLGANGSFPVDVSAAGAHPLGLVELALAWHCEGCPAGRFGQVPWLLDASCSGACREGGPRYDALAARASFVIGCFVEQHNRHKQKCARLPPLFCTSLSLVLSVFSHGLLLWDLKATSALSGRRAPTSTAAAAWASSAPKAARSRCLSATATSPSRAPQPKLRWTRGSWRSQRAWAAARWQPAAAAAARPWKQPATARGPRPEAARRRAHRARFASGAWRTFAHRFGSCFFFQNAVFALALLVHTGLLLFFFLHASS